MSKQIFASTIISKLSGSITQDGTSYNEGSPATANQAIADGITEYLLGHVNINIAYSGIIPGTPPVPDNCSDIIPLIGQCPPPEGTDFETWVKSIETCIMSGFYLGVGKGLVTPSGSILAFPNQGLQIDQGELTPIHQGNMDSPQQPIWEKICEKIIDWITGMATIPTYPALHISSTGVSTLISTIII